MPLLILPMVLIMIKTKSKQNITPEKAIEILAKHGTIVTKEEAKLILEFMYKFSILAINQVVRNSKLNNHGNKKP